MYIKITDVNKTIKKAPILRDINVEFTGGKVYGLRGKNGSGKTMLMRAICGLITPDSGIIDIDGKILGKDISFPESIGVLIENPAFIGNYTGLKNLKVLASIQNRIGDEQIRKALEDIGLDPEKTARVTFNEITKDVVKKSIKEAREIDMDLVNAQQARRELDKILLYHCT